MKTANKRGASRVIDFVMTSIVALLVILTVTDHGGIVLKAELGVVALMFALVSGACAILSVESVRSLDGRRWLWAAVFFGAALIAALTAFLMLFWVIPNV